MADDPTTPENYTHLAVQIGVLQEGNRNILDGVNDIKTTLVNHGDRIGTVESHAAATDVRLTNVESGLAIVQAAARPVKGLFWGIGGSVIGLLAFALTLLNQLYGK